MINHHPYITFYFFLKCFCLLFLPFFVNEVISACIMTGGEVYDKYIYSSIVYFFVIIKPYFCSHFSDFLLVPKNTAINYSLRE